MIGPRSMLQLETGENITKLDPQLRIGAHESHAAQGFARGHYGMAPRSEVLAIP